MWRYFVSLVERHFPGEYAGCMASKERFKHVGTAPPLPYTPGHPHVVGTYAQNWSRSREIHRDTRRYGVGIYAE
eukprot:1863565-Pleurochrysis_carterae.AAC.1